MLEGKYKTRVVSDILMAASMKPKVESRFWGNWLALPKNQNRIPVIKEIIEKRKIQNYTPILSADIFNPSISILSDFYFYPDNYEKYYGGHQFRLGHYYRHYFQAIKFINHEHTLTYREKYGFAKLFRAQLSTYEQAIFFLNSLSQLGRVWEFELKSNPIEGKNSNNQLITKFNLIKNIPGSLIFKGLEANTFYPLVEFEGAAVASDSRTKRHALELSYY